MSVTPIAIDYPLIFSGNMDELELYRGPMTFQGNSGISFDAVGSLKFKLLPSPKTYLHLQAVDRIGQMKIINDKRGVVRTPSMSVSAVVDSISLNMGDGAEEKDDLRGFLFGDSSIDRSRMIDTSYFVLVNMPEVTGAFIKRGSNEVRGRINLAHDDYEILIDPVPNLKNLVNRLKDNRTSAITHVGKITKNSGDFSIKDLDILLPQIGQSLTFAIGRAIQPMLTIGIHKTKIVFQEPITNVSSDLFDTRTNWFDCFEASQLEEVFHLMTKKFHKTNDPLAITKLVNWYREAERSELALESRIVLVTTALDYFSWHLLVLILRTKNKVQFKADNLSKNLAEMLANASIPEGLDASFVSDKIRNIAEKIEAISGPDLIARIRNSIIHPNRHATLDKLDVNELFAVKSLASLYLEFMILWYIGYGGKLSNRLKLPHYTGDYIQVPWAPKAC